MPRYSAARSQFYRGTEAGAAVSLAKSTLLTLANGAGVTIDDVILRAEVSVTITAARIVYSDATTGTVATANARIGTTVGGAEICAATAYANTAAVGTVTAMTIVSGAVPANTPVLVRHTGIIAGAAGQAYVEIEYSEAY